MKDLIITISTFGLSILANIATPAVQKAVGVPTEFRLLNYWYVFVIIIVVALLIDGLRILNDEDRSSLWRGRAARLQLLVHRTKTNEKKYIINDLNGRINLARRQLQMRNRLLPRLVKVEWVDEYLSEGQTYDLKEGEFVVRVSSKDSQEKNIIDIVGASTRRTSLVGIRHVVSNNKPFEASLDEVMSENVILQINNRHLRDIYYRDHLQPCLDKDQVFQKYFERAKTVDRLGLFFPIYLTELEYFADRITGQGYRPFLLGEVEQFLDFLSQLTPEKTVVGVELQFEKAFLKTGILLTKSEKIMSAGVAPYLRMVEAYLSRQYHSFYLEYFETRSRLNWKKFQELVDDLVKEITSYPTIERDFDKHYIIHDDDGTPREARCFRFIISDRYAVERT